MTEQTPLTVTIHFMRAGRFMDAIQIQTDNTDRQRVADAAAAAGRGTGYDLVQVWFGPLDGREPDATAAVAA